MKKMILLLSALFALLYTYGQAVSPDSTFAGKGWTYTDFKKGNYYNEIGQQVLLQKDGSVILVITLESQYLVMAHYHADGSLDSSFGTDGYTEPVSASSVGGAQGMVALQSDGKIIVAGGIGMYSGRDMTLRRYTTEGVPDKSFGVDGVIRTDLGGSDYVYSLAVQSDDRIVVAAESHNYTTDRTYLDLVRYTKDGVLDASFDGDGKLSTEMGEYYLTVFMAVQNDGKIVVCRIFQNPDPEAQNIVLTRYNIDGSADVSLDGDGRLVTKFFSIGDVSTLAVQDDGKILLAGLAIVNDDQSDFALRRYNADGSVDKGFGAEGKQTTDFGGEDYASSLVVQSDGKIVMAGYTVTPGTDHVIVALARYHEDGSPDESFDGDGKQTTDFEILAGALSLAVQSDGQIVVAGVTVQPDPFATDYLLARYTIDGSLDNGFNSDGKLVGYYPAGLSEINSVAVQSDGKIIVAGGCSDVITSMPQAATIFRRPLAVAALPAQRRTNVGVARYMADGSLDSSFGVNGTQTFDMGGIEEATSLVVQQDGKILIAGISSDTETYIPYLFLARLNTDGSFDNSFDGDGKLVTGFYSFGEEQSLALQPDGKIVVTANVFDPENGIIEFAVARYHADGSIDNTFNGNGRSVGDFGSIAAAFSLAIQDDGKIVATGVAEGPETNNLDFALARYNTDGSLDQSFGGDGTLTTDYDSGFDFTNSIKIQADGKIVVTGVTYTYYKGNLLVALGRYNPNGSLDSSFDGNGKLTSDLFDWEVYSGSDPAPLAVSDPFTPSMTLQSNGKIVVAGTTRYHSFNHDHDFALARYNADGSADSSFGNKGKLIKDFEQGSDHATSLFISRDRLYVVGNSTSVTQRGILAAYRFDCMDREICGNRVDDNCDGQIDEGCPNTPFLTINDVTVSEDLQRATLMVTLSKKATEPVQVSYFTVDRTAVSNIHKGQADYEAKSGTVTIPAGQQTAVISINIFQDNLIEGDEFFDVHLQRPVHAALSGDKGRVTIKDAAAGIPIINRPVVQEEQSSAPTLTLKAQPNPSAGLFTVLVQSPGNSPIVLKVSDAMGRLVETKTGITSHTSLQLGQSYRPGIYYLEAVQGSERASLKLVKQSN